MSNAVVGSAVRLSNTVLIASTLTVAVRHRVPNARLRRGRCCAPTMDRSIDQTLPGCQRRPYVPTPSSDNAHDEHPRARFLECSKRFLSHSRVLLSRLRRLIRRNESEKITHAHLLSVEELYKNLERFVESE